MQNENNGRQLTIIGKNKSAHDNIITTLKNEFIEFHTYERKEDKKPKIVLKGLPLLPTDDIHEELIKYKVNPLSIHLIRAKNNTNVNQATYLITLNSINKLKQTKNIKYLCNMIIEWDRYKKSNKPTQCYNCQSFGHGSNNCYKTSKCVKCAGKHISTECKSTSYTPKCSNCNGEHQANDLNCPNYINYLSNINKNKINNNQGELPKNECESEHLNHNKIDEIKHNTKYNSYAKAVKNINQHNNEGYLYQYRHQYQQHHLNDHHISNQPSRSIVNGAVSVNNQTDSALNSVIKELSNCPEATLNKIVSILRLSTLIMHDNTLSSKLENLTQKSSIDAKLDSNIINPIVNAQTDNEIGHKAVKKLSNETEINSGSEIVTRIPKTQKTNIIGPLDKNKNKNVKTNDKSITAINEGRKESGKNNKKNG